MRKFLVSLSDCNLDRSTFRGLGDVRQSLDWRVDANFMQRVRAALPRLPPVERDVIELYFVQSKKQEVIARMLDLSQQAVSHRLQTAYRRLIFMLAQPEVLPAQMRRDLQTLLPNPFTVLVLCDFAETSSQTVTARRLGVPQQRICWHLNAGLRSLRESPHMDAVFYVQYFEALRQNRNILREVLAGRRKKVCHGEEQRFAGHARGIAASYGGGPAHGSRGAAVRQAAVAGESLSASVG